MGIVSTVLKSFFKVQINLLEPLISFPPAIKKLFISLSSKDTRLNNVDDIMKIILVANRLQNIPLVSKNAKISRKVFHERIQSITKPCSLNVSTQDHTIHTKSHDLTIRHYKPSHVTQTNQKVELPGVILFFHGGCFVVGSVETHDSFCKYLSHYSELQVLSLEYRLAPEFPAPAGFHDCLTALNWVHDNAGVLNINPEKIYVAGDSAGGNLAAVLCQQTQTSAIKPKAQLLIYPVIDATCEYQSYRDFGNGLVLNLKDKHQYEYYYIYNSRLKPDNPLISPILGNVDDIPPAYIVTAELDFLVDEGEAYAHKLRGAHIPTYVERMYGLPHGFIHFADLHPQSMQAVIKTANGFKQFINEHT